MALNLQVENELGTTAQSVKDQNGNTSSLTLSTDTVGIGTPNPQGKLDVSGNIVLNGNAKTQLSATRDSTVLKGSPIILDLSPLGGGQLQIGNNIDDNKIFLEGFSRDGNGHASEMLITGRFAQSLPLFSVLADIVRLLGTVQIGSSLEVNGNILASGDIRLANADCAEEFDICETEQIEPGTVMVLGEDGKLKQSQMAYDKRVAGVISGAGDYFDCLPRKLRTVVYVCSMEPIVYTVSNDRSGQAHCAASASGVRPTSATSCRTETPRARSPQCPGESAGALWQASIFFPRCVSRTRNHVASNESV